MLFSILYFLCIYPFYKAQIPSGFILVVIFILKKIILYAFFNTKNYPPFVIPLGVDYSRPINSIPIDHHQVIKVFVEIAMCPVLKVMHFKFWKVKNIVFHRSRIFFLCYGQFLKFALWSISWRVQSFVVVAWKPFMKNSTSYCTYCSINVNALWHYR